jgi:hypothetical protein
MIQDVAKIKLKKKRIKGGDCELKAWSENVFRPVDTQATGLQFVSTGYEYSMTKATELTGSLGRKQGPIRC